MADKKNEAAGLPFRRQSFGGYNKVDVAEYIEDLVAKVEAERGENEKIKQQFYILMKNGQAFCDDLSAQARRDSNALMEETQQKVNASVQAANEQLQRLREEREGILEQTKADMKKLAGIVALQRQQAAQAYDNILRPVTALLSGLEGNDSGS